jgi:hypothetical protein
MAFARATLWTILISAAGVAPLPRSEAADGSITATAETVSITAAAIEMARVPAVSFELMQRELDTLLGGTGVRVRWRRASAASETRTDELRVVFLDGPGRGLYADRPVLAASRHVDPGPTIWVFTPSVVAALGQPVQRREAPDVTRALGLALGRVLAHELVHVLAPEIPHGHGVMAERFRLVALEQTRPALVPACVQALARGARDWASRGGRRRDAPPLSGSAAVSLASDAGP